ncbi:MAG: transketolase, partial [Candidatus Omnitrophica bacterium]|nr:transketolase [Candidatus Omnitrophota bacterium]
GNYFFGMVRSITPIITTTDGRLFYDANYEFEYGTSDVLRDGKHGFIYTMGALVSRAVAISDQLKQEGIEIGVVNYSCPVTIDENVLNMGIKTGLIISYEDHVVDSGLGMTIATYIAEKQKIVKFHRLGIRKYGSSGAPDDLYAEHSLDIETVKDLIRKLLKV